MKADGETKQGRGHPPPRSAMRIMRILRLAALHPDGLNLTQMAAELDVPKTSLHSLLRALLDESYLVQVGTYYRLGDEAYSLASMILSSTSFPDVAVPVMQDLAKATGETIFISELSDDEPAAVYIARVESAHPIRMMASIGEKRPLYSSSGGRCLLAFQSAEWQANYLDVVDVVAHTDKTVTDKSRIRAMLREIRSSGVARSNEDLHDEVSAFASPIFGADGRIRAALIIGAPTSRAEKRASEFERLVRLHADKITKTIGGDPEVGMRPRGMDED